MALQARRALSLLVLGLLASGLAVISVGSASSPAQAAPLLERWCGPGVAQPCLLAVTRDGVTQSAATSEVLLTDWEDLGGYWSFMVLVSQGDLAETQDWELLIDTGTRNPDMVSGFLGDYDVDPVDDGDGTYQLRVSGKPVLHTSGCDTGAAWPYPCPTVATDEQVMLEFDVHDRSDEFVGFYAGTSAIYNGLFLETAADGSRYFSTELVNSHFRPDGTTVYTGRVRYRMPYPMLRDSFGVPDPATMVPSSLSGTVNGSPAGSFAVQHDPDGGGLVVDFSNLTFSLNRIKVKRGVIVPTRPTGVTTARVATGRGRIGFEPSSPRGARVTGYRAVCVSGSGHTASATGADSPVVVTGLRAGKGYSCRVAALSKAGRSPWSARKELAARP